MKKILFLFCLAIVNFSIAQELKTTAKLDIKSDKKIEYQFKTIVDIDATTVKSQGKTGTCWSFSASSFFESEIYREIGKFIDISEMYTVRNAYFRKAWIYVMRQGKSQLSDGGLGHHTMNSIKAYGLVPESEFSGLLGESKTHNHNNLTSDIKTILDAYIKNDKDSNHPNWKVAIDSVLTNRIGKNVKEFVYEGKIYTPKTFLEMTRVNPIDYVTITSFTHIPDYKLFILNIPDNFDFGSFYNVPLEELNQIATEVLRNGYSIEWDGDISEKTFSAKNGVAVIPNNKKDIENSLTHIVEELAITPQFRQEEFENFNTTDDHLMHIIGIVKDQNDNMYYKVKNSWGTNSERVGNDGYILMSESYFKLKSISIMVHKDAIPKEIREKLKI